MRSFTIGGRTITQDSKPFVIAEIGNNCFVQDDPEQKRSLALCKALMKRAKQNGADAVKLQKRTPRELYTRELFDMPYPGDNSYGPTYGLHREKLEFSKEKWAELTEYAKKLNILLFATAFDVEAVNFLEQFDLPAYKVASGLLRDIPLIQRVSSLGKPVVISTGGATWEDIDRVYKVMKRSRTEFCFLHCTMEYPCAPENVNLRVIPAMMERYPDIIIGFSDHTVGTWAMQAAYRYGAQVFEKHFTVNKALPGPDHSLSIEPHELQELIHCLERIQAATGTPEKKFIPAEQKGYYKMAKGIYSKRLIVKGTPIGFDNIAIKSPADGLEPYHLEEIQGKRAKVDLLPEQPITADVLENYST